MGNRCGPQLGEDTAPSIFLAGARTSGS